MQALPLLLALLSLAPPAHAGPRAKIVAEQTAQISQLREGVIHRRIDGRYKNDWNTCELDVELVDTLRGNAIRAAGVLDEDPLKAIPILTIQDLCGKGSYVEMASRDLVDLHDHWTVNIQDSDKWQLKCAETAQALEERRFEAVRTARDMGEDPAPLGKLSLAIDPTFCR